MLENHRHMAHRVQIAAAAAAVCIFVAGSVSYAWFHAQRNLHTFTHVEAPSTLSIFGPNETAITQIDLSTVDLTNETHKASFVFCVVGTGHTDYDLELAYTTNVPFDYAVRKTTQEDSEPASGEALTFTDSTGTYYYPVENKTGPIENGLLTGRYINWVEETGNAVLDNTESNKHSIAYETYEQVQIHAEPVYYLFEDNPVRNPQNDATSAFVDYYILELTWTETTAAAYAKETDLVYLLASN